MLRALLPGAVAVSEVFGDLDEALFPEELERVSRAVPRRIAEFRSVRGCARRALAELGLERPVMVPGDRGAPVWPDGVIGSMTHCEGFRAAAATRDASIAALGIDAETHEPLPGQVLDLVCGAWERRHLEALTSARDDVHWDRIVFSAKESVYKAWFPLARTWLGFEDATVRCRPDGTFLARLHARGPLVAGRPLSAVPGRWAVHGPWVVTCVVVGSGSQGATPPHRGRDRRRPPRGADGAAGAGPAAPPTRPR